jgi:hypothetical protein
MAQAHSKVARPLMRADRRSCDAKRTTALPLPREETRLGPIVGWTTNRNPKLVNKASNFVNQVQPNAGLTPAGSSL